MNVIEEIAKSRYLENWIDLRELEREPIFVEGFKAGVYYYRLPQDLAVVTFSNRGKWAEPFVDIKSDEVMYTSQNKGGYGIQLSERLSPMKGEIVALCNEISDKIYELNALLRK